MHASFAAVRRACPLAAAGLTLALTTPSAIAAEPSAPTTHAASKPFDGALVAADFNYLTNPQPVGAVVVLIGANTYG